MFFFFNTKTKTKKETGQTSLMKASRCLPLKIFARTTGNIVSICETVNELSESNVFASKKTKIFVVDIALFQKFFLRNTSFLELQQEKTKDVVFVPGIWHTFRHGLKLLWEKGFFFGFLSLKRFLYVIVMLTISKVLFFCF